MRKPDDRVGAAADPKSDGSSDGIGVQTQFDRSGGRPALADTDFTVTYSYEREPAGTHIYPEAPYLSLLEQGGPISGIRFWWSAFSWQFPKLSIKMANNTDATVFVTEVAVEVKSSSVNTDPVIIIEYNPYKVGYFSIINEGWGQVVSPRLKLQIAPVESYDAFSSVLPQHEVQLATFFEEADVRIESYVVDDLRDQRVVAVFGELEYHTESNRPQWLRFRTKVSLVHPGPGFPAPPNYTYDLFLEAGHSGYIRNLPLHQEMPPRATDHFLIRIGTNKSARFDLVFSFRTTAGTRLPEKSVLLDVFVPRTQAGKIRGPSSVAPE
jgi:hypothetical protein